MHTDELIRLAVIGDAKAFTSLWDEYKDCITVFLRSWIKNIDSFYVDDICSRTFEKAFRQISSFDRGKSQFQTWLKTIARNTALDVLQQEHSRGFVPLDEVVDSVTLSQLKDDVDTPLESIIRLEDKELTEKCIEGLPDLYRDIARKRLVQGMQYQEIADETGEKLNTVRTRIRRARTMIEEMKLKD